MKAKKLGQYYYAPCGRNWGVWQYTFVCDDASCASKVQTFFSKDEAEAFVYKNNGWGTRRKLS
ncbi:MAG: hypothetical protein J5663_07360 [Bacteroidaceae bacterium]|nr:hypothetical protein [Bacteroidaceae bacterium]